MYAGRVKCPVPEGRDNTTFLSPVPQCLHTGAPERQKKKNTNAGGGGRGRQSILDVVSVDGSRSFPVPPHPANSWPMAPRTFDDRTDQSGSKIFGFPAISSMASSTSRPIWSTGVQWQFPNSAKVERYAQVDSVKGSPRVVGV